jgi:F-type H+-transporting ATPase subunit epsilon
MAFQCVIVTPEQQVLDTQIAQAIVPAHDGLVGLRTDRAPLLVKLGLGPLRIDLPNNQKQFFLIDGGIAQMKDNKLTILTNQATPASEIDASSAQAELAEASALRAVDDKAFEKRQHDVAKARFKQQMAAGR